MTDAPPDRQSSRERIVQVAARLLHDQGQAAVTTRSVAEAAGVHPPTLYRLFGDRDGLLDAVVEQTITDFTATKETVVRAAAAEGVDPVDDLRAGWRMTIDFGLANPDLFVLMNNPLRRPSPAALAGSQLLVERIRRVAQAGRLRVTEGTAFDLVRAAATGAVLTILAKPGGERDPALADMLFEALLAQVLSEADADADADADARAGAGAGAGSVVSGPVRHAVALRAHVDDLPALSAGERAVLGEWLERVVGGPHSSRDERRGVDR